jgi:hypothetical protein
LIFDSLTQRLLRRIPSPASPHHEREGVSQIVVDGDLLLIGVGGQVVAWQARREAEKGTNAWSKAGKGKKSASGRGGVPAKWHRKSRSALQNMMSDRLYHPERNELNTEISHSLKQLKDESARSQPALHRARAQVGALAEMGMDEADAVQYLMMLSRDEEDVRRAAEAANGCGHEGEGDTGWPGTEVGYGSPTHSDRHSKSVHGSPTNSTRSTVPSASTSPSSKRSGLSVYIPANGRPRTSASDIPDANPYLSRSPYGSHQSGRSYRSGGSGGEGSLLDEDDELRMVLELSLLEQ